MTDVNTQIGTDEALDYEAQWAAQEVAITETDYTLKRFRAAQQLGDMALRLQEESRRIFQSIEQLEVDEFEAPADIGILLNTTHPEDPFDAEYRHGLHEADTFGWARTVPGGKMYNAHISEASNGSERSFTGKSIEFDKDTKSFWVYNEAKNFRVRLRKDIEVTAVDLTY